MILFSKKQYEDIGRIVIFELEKNRGLRREIERSPIYPTFVAIMERDDTFKPVPVKKSWWRKFVDMFKKWNESEMDKSVN